MAVTIVISAQVHRKFNIGSRFVDVPSLLGLTTSNFEAVQIKNIIDYRSSGFTQEFHVPNRNLSNFLKIVQEFGIAYM